MAYKKRKKNKGKKIAIGITSAVLITGVAAGAILALDRVQVSAQENENAEVNEELQTKIDELETSNKTLSDQVNVLTGEKEQLTGKLSELEETIKTNEDNKTSISVANSVMNVLAEDMAFIDYYNDDVTSVNSNGEAIDFNIVYTPQSSYAVGDKQEVLYFNGNEESNDYAIRTLNVIDGEFATVYENDVEIGDIVYLEEEKIIDRNTFTGISNLRLFNYGSNLEVSNITIAYLNSGGGGSITLSEENPTFRLGLGKNYFIDLTFTINIENEDDSVYSKSFVKRITYCGTGFETVLLTETSDQSDVSIVNVGFNSDTLAYELTFNAFGDENVVYTISNQNIVRAIESTGWIPFGSDNNINNRRYKEYSISQSMAFGMFPKRLWITINKTLDDGTTVSIDFALLTDSIAEQYAEIQMA